MTFTVFFSCSYMQNSLPVERSSSLLVLQLNRLDSYPTERQTPTGKRLPCRSSFSNYFICRFLIGQAIISHVLCPHHYCTGSDPAHVPGSLWKRWSGPAGNGESPSPLPSLQFFSAAKSFSLEISAAEFASWWSPCMSCWLAMGQQMGVTLKMTDRIVWEIIIRKYFVKH